jgi:hypothetical protein
MKKSNKIYGLNFCIAGVWMVNGFFCKVLNLVPRHQEIVARILGEDQVRLWTVLIGFAEFGMAIWIITGITPRLNAIVQIIAVAMMNALEFTLAPDLLLWGRFNALFAFLFNLLIYYNEFRFRNKLAQLA